MQKLENDKLEEIARESAKKAVQETFTSLGLEAYAPHEMQADMLYLRKIRKGSEFISLRAKASMIAFLVPTFLYLLWEAVKSSLQE